VIRLTNELRLANERLAALELEVLNSRDHAIGRATEVGELRHRLLAQAAMYERRLSEARQTHATHDVNHGHISRNLRMRFPQQVPQRAWKTVKQVR